MAAFREFTGKQIETMVSRYKQGDTLQELATRYDVSASTISRILRDEGVKLRSRGRRASKVS